MSGRLAVDPLREYSPARFDWFCRYLSFYLPRRFHALRLHAAGAPPALDRPTVFYANHPSWWDPLVLMWTLRRLWPEVSVFGPMDVDALRRYAFFRRLGLFAIERGTFRGAAEFLRQSRRVLARPGHALCVTAQGAFADARLRPVTLARGVAHLLASGHAAEAVPVALEYPFWTDRRPEALVRFGAAVRPAGRGVAEIHAALEHALEDALDALAAPAVARDAAMFETLLGRSGDGVGGGYRGSQRLRATSARAARLARSREPLTG